MSSHCSRYPACGCTSSIGVKCHLSEGDPRLLEKEVDNTADEIDWDKISKIKEAEREKFERLERGGKSKKPHRKYPTNYTPPKKKRKRKN